MRTGHLYSRRRGSLGSGMATAEEAASRSSPTNIINYSISETQIKMLILWKYKYRCKYKYNSSVYMNRNIVHRKNTKDQTKIKASD